jgi:transcriptional regulatory protein GAL4
MVNLDDSFISPWLGSLPHYFQQTAAQPSKYVLAHASLHWRYRNFRILMYRPFLVRRVMAKDFDNTEDSSDPRSEDIAFQRCLESARESVDMISSFYFNHQHLQTMMSSWYSLYFLFQAILIPVVCLRNNPQSPTASSWRDQVFEAIRVLEAMVEVIPTSKRCLKVLRSLCEPYLSLEQSLDGPTEELIQDQLTGLYPMMWPTLGGEFAQIDGYDAL